VGGSKNSPQRRKSQRTSKNNNKKLTSGKDSEILNLHSNIRQTRDSKMSVPIPKKMVSRSVAVALGIICIVLIVGLVGVMAYYAMNTTSNATYNDYVSSHSHTNSEYDSMWAPKLIEVDLGATQHGVFLGSPYLNVNGYVVNVHENWAYNCKLHVVAYQSGGVTAIDTYINLGTIAGESSTKVDSNINYVAGDIASYALTLQWNATQ
jgi:hypothetical protein